jgi:uncharacterized RmlC-like cupin family protein
MAPLLLICQMMTKNETSLYVVSGILRLEFKGFESYLDAEAGDFILVLTSPCTVRATGPTNRPSR